MRRQVGIEESVADFDGYVLFRIIEVTSNDDAFSIFIDSEKDWSLINTCR